ncbi:MAG: BatA and WFA domain-containing protein [Verrucomicrobiota bacterium]
MSFFNPGLFWWLLPVIAVPLLVHWLNRRFPRRFLFSSIEEIKKSMAGRSRIFRWRHWLLLALRTLALLALAAAFLRPMVATKVASAGKKRHSILIIDHSLSMTHTQDGATALSRAHAEARRLLESFDADDRFQIIRADQAPAPAFPEFTTDRGGALAWMKSLPAPATRADMQAANRLAGELSRGLTDAPDVYVFSDFQRKNWADVDFSALPAASRLFFISSTNDERRDNRAILSITPGEGAVVVGAETEVTIRVGNYSPDPWTGKIEVGFDPAHLREKKVNAAPWSETDVKLVVPVPSGGLCALEASIPSDDLTADDQRRVVVRVSEREEVVIVSRAAENKTVGPALFLGTAVNPFDGNAGAYRPRVIEAAALTPAALAATTRVILTRVPELREPQAAALVSFLRGGGGILWFLDGENEAANLKRFAAAAGSEPPLRVTGRIGPEDLPDGAMRVAKGDFRSRFLRLFEGERRKNLALLEFYDLHRAAGTGTGKTLLSYADGTPAMVEYQVGPGTLLVCNFSVAEAASNLARQRLFPAWIHEILLRMNATNSAVQETYLPGDSISTEVWTADARGRDMDGPGGKVERLRKDDLGERTRVSFTASAPGIYSMSGGNNRPLAAFAVNADTVESDLRPLDPEILPDRAGGGRPEAEFVGNSPDFTGLVRGKPAFHWFVIAALGLLLIEGALFKATPRQAATKEP